VLLAGLNPKNLILTLVPVPSMALRADAKAIAAVFANEFYDSRVPIASMTRSVATTNSA
jgi:hypothetical protein